MKKVCRHDMRTKVRFIRTTRMGGVTHDVSLFKCQKCGQEFEDALTRTNPVFDLWFLNQSIPGEWSGVQIFRNSLALPHPHEEGPVNELRASTYWGSHLEPCEHIGRALVITWRFDRSHNLAISGVYTLNDGGLSDNFMELLKKEVEK